MKNFLTLCLIFVSSALFAQNLVFNGDFEQGNTGFTSTYTLGPASGNMGPSHYRVTNSSKYWYPATWAKCSDHGNDPDSMMMVMDAFTTPNQAIWCQSITNIKPNTTYKFSAWVASVISLAPATLRFSINGEILGDTIQAKSTTCQWNEFYEVWNSGNATTADICIVNINTIQNGNDFALDDISLVEVGLKMPNVFTPNADGSNDTFHPFVFEEIDSYSFIILNRWGIKVFEQTLKAGESPVQPEWNGKLMGTGSDCAEGTYYWVLNYNVNSLSGSGTKALTGYLTLLNK
ncbi:MAG: gliding motility-associated C-terminal domain-containing protein [Flavobacteriales bacterium]